MSRSGLAVGGSCKSFELLYKTLLILLNLLSAPEHSPKMNGCCTALVKLALSKQPAKKSTI